MKAFAWPEFLAKRVRARSLGAPLWRTSDFVLPGRVRIGGVWHRTNLPDESGVRVAFLEVLLADCYGLTSLPATLRTVVDVGANVGVFTLAARRCFPDATIHAYEPNAALAVALAVQVRAAHAELFLEAVGATAGRVSLDFGVESVLTQTRRDPAGSVPCVALRTVVERIGGQADLVKLDCEGAEWEILSDVDAWLGVQRLVMEYHLDAAHTHADALGAVRAIGMMVLRHEPAGHVGLLSAERRSGRPA